MRPNAVRTTLAAALLGCLSVSCGSAPPKSEPTGVDRLVIPTPTPDAADFATRIDNPYLPLSPGSTWAYASTGSDGDETITTRVLDETRVVAGVRTTVVHDVVKDAEGQVVEDTYDWYAQDREGNVWYFGEDTRTFEDGVPSTEGSWEAGVGGAMAGVVMLAAPRLGDGYQQEYLPGVAEDRARVLALDATASVPYGDFVGVLQTEETTPLEPGLVERKSYVRGVGIVFEVTVSGADEVVQLVSFLKG